ncbi:hypothetical protein, partial [Staphylococcus aureus]
MDRALRIFVINESMLSPLLELQSVFQIAGPSDPKIPDIAQNFEQIDTCGIGNEADSGDQTFQLFRFVRKLRAAVTYPMTTIDPCVENARAVNFTLPAACVLFEITNGHEVSFTCIHESRWDARGVRVQPVPRTRVVGDGARL